MAISADVQARFDRLDAATTEIANDLRALREAATDRPLNAEELAMFDAKIAVLDELGKDPVEPPPA